MQHRPKVYYALYATNADLEQVRFIYKASHLDCLETFMWQLFKTCDYEEDFMIVNTNSYEIQSMILSARSQALRGECQG